MFFSLEKEEYMFKSECIHFQKRIEVLKNSATDQKQQSKVSQTSLLDNTI